MGSHDDVTRGTVARAFLSKNAGSTAKQFIRCLTGPKKCLQLSAKSSMIICNSVLKKL